MTHLVRRGIQLNSFETGWRIAGAIVTAGMQPKSFGEVQQGAPDNVRKAQFERARSACFVAMQAGAEIGLSPMQAIQNIAVINGKPGIYGPAALGLVKASGLLVGIVEGIEGKGNERFAFCKLQRVGEPERCFTFSVSDAKVAGLWGKSGPWTQYPDRMLTARARGFALRDVFPDVLLGLAYSIEELSDGSAERVHDVAPPPPVQLGTPPVIEVSEATEVVAGAALPKPTPPAPAAPSAEPTSSDLNDFLDAAEEGGGQ